MRGSNRPTAVEGPRGACPFRLPGQVEDEDTGLYYNRFRWYDPELGLYISKDPIGLLGGERLYAYVSDLFVWYDPYGLIKAPASLPHKPGVYILTNGKQAYVGSSGIGKQGMNKRVSSSSHAKAQKLLGKPGTVVEYVQVDLGTLTDPSQRNNALRYIEQREFKRVSELDNMTMLNSSRGRIQALNKKSMARGLIRDKNNSVKIHRRKTCK